MRDLFGLYDVFQKGEGDRERAACQSKNGFVELIYSLVLAFDKRIEVGGVLIGAGVLAIPLFRLLWFVAVCFGQRAFHCDLDGIKKGK